MLVVVLKVLTSEVAFIEPNIHSVLYMYNVSASMISVQKVFHLHAFHNYQVTSTKINAIL